MSNIGCCDYINKCNLFGITMTYEASIMLNITHLFEFMWLYCPSDNNIGRLVVDIDWPKKIYSLALYYFKRNTSENKICVQSTLSRIFIQ